MNKQFIEEKTASLKENKKILEKEVLDIREKLLPYKEYANIISYMDKKEYDIIIPELLQIHYDGDLYKRLQDSTFKKIFENLENITDEQKDIIKTIESRKPLVFLSRQEVNTLEALKDVECEIGWYYKNILDSEYKQMDGDIIITDPGYLLKEEDDSCEFEEWKEKVKELNNFCDTWGIRRNTIYGDWSCTTYDLDTKKIIGNFCADGGEVVVIPLEKALEYNPDFNYHIEKLWTTTLIKDFHGKVKIIVEEEKDLRYEDYSVHIIGKGNINFKTSQTGL